MGQEEDHRHTNLEIGTYIFVFITLFILQTQMLYQYKNSRVIYSLKFEQVLWACDKCAVYSFLHLATDSKVAISYLAPRARDNIHQYEPTNVLSKKKKCKSYRLS